MDFQSVSLTPPFLQGSSGEPFISRATPPVDTPSGTHLRSEKALLSRSPSMTARSASPSDVPPVVLCRNVPADRAFGTPAHSLEDCIRGSSPAAEVVQGELALLADHPPDVAVLLPANVGLGVAPLDLDNAQDIVEFVHVDGDTVTNVGDARELSEAWDIESASDAAEVDEAIWIEGIAVGDAPVISVVAFRKLATRLLGLLYVVFYATTWAVFKFVYVVVCLLRIIIAAKYPVAIVLVAYITFTFVPRATVPPRTADAVSTGLCTVSGMLFCPLSPSDAVSPRDSDIAAGIASDASARPTSHPTIIDFPGLMAVQSRILDALLAHSAAGSELSLGVKHAELAVQDLLFLVRTSNLAEKTALARTIEEFATDAKVAGRLLQHFSSKLDGTVDTVLAFNEFALHVLDDMRQPGMVDRQNTMMEVFESALDTLASQVAGVEVDASIALAALDALGDRLMLVQALCEHEFLSNGQYPSATSFWSMITGDVPERRQLAYRLEVLNNLDAYRRRSLAYITATTQTLVMIESDVSELHRKLVAPQSEAGELPIDVHIATIERSARRLNDERVRRGSRMGITGSAVDNLEV